MCGRYDDDPFGNEDVDDKELLDNLLFAASLHHKTSNPISWSTSRVLHLPNQRLLSSANEAIALVPGLAHTDSQANEQINTTSISSTSLPPLDPSFNAPTHSPQRNHLIPFLHTSRSCAPPLESVCIGIVLRSIPLKNWFPTPLGLVPWIGRMGFASVAFYNGRLSSYGTTNEMSIRWMGYA